MSQFDLKDGAAICRRCGSAVVTSKDYRGVEDLVTRLRTHRHGWERVRWWATFDEADLLRRWRESDPNT